MSSAIVSRAMMSIAMVSIAVHLVRQQAGAPLEVESAALLGARREERFKLRALVGEARRERGPALVPLALVPHAPRTQPGAAAERRELAGDVDEAHAPWQVSTYHGKCSHSECGGRGRRLGKCTHPGPKARSTAATTASFSTGFMLHVE